MGPVVAFSDATNSLLAALFGALVGGVASLAGSVVVNRHERAMEARQRLYEVLVPAARIAWLGMPHDRIEPDLSNFITEVSPLLGPIRRASVIAGRRERQLAGEIVQAWNQLGSLAAKAYASRATVEDLKSLDDQAIGLLESISQALSQLTKLLERRLD